MHEVNSFVTLTYSDQALPLDRSLRPRDAQLWLKRFRKRVGSPIRFFLCGEYGTRTHRPHYHALLFGYWPPDASYWKGSGKGQLFRSEELDETWQHGQVLVGRVSFESAAYVARYCLGKKFSRLSAPEFVDVDSGELTKLEPEFLRMSRRPGLGRAWLEQYHQDVFPHGAVVMNGVEGKTPRYYDSWFQARDAQAFERLRLERAALAESKFDDESPARRRVKDEVLRAQVGQLKRSL